MNTFPEKEAPVDHEIYPLLKKRWSPRAFSAEPIEEEKINSLFEAARWAPSSFNGQPWRYIYATKDKPEQYEKLASLLNEGNQWAKNAYMLLIICSKKNFEYNGKENRHAIYDAGTATENLFLQAVSMGLIAHEMAGFAHEEAHELLGVPEDTYVMTIMAIGYPGDPSELPEDLQEREKAPRERKKISEFAFEGEWKN